MAKNEHEDVQRALHKQMNVLEQSCKQTQALCQHRHGLLIKLLKLTQSAQLGVSTSTQSVTVDSTAHTVRIVQEHCWFVREWLVVMLSVHNTQNSDLNEVYVTSAAHSPCHSRLITKPTAQSISVIKCSGTERVVLWLAASNPMNTPIHVQIHWQQSKTPNERVQHHAQSYIVNTANTTRLSGAHDQYEHASVLTMLHCVQYSSPLYMNVDCVTTLHLHPVLRCKQLTIDVDYEVWLCECAQVDQVWLWVIKEHNDNHKYLVLVHAWSVTLCLELPLSFGSRLCEAHVELVVNGLKELSASSLLPSTQSMVHAPLALNTLNNTTALNTRAFTLAVLDTLLHTHK